MTGEGTLVIKELQLEGKKRMPVDAFLRGYSVPIGTKLG
jgi:methionyl-tRNA formyltransferase